MFIFDCDLNFSLSVVSCAAPGDTGHYAESGDRFLQCTSYLVDCVILFYPFLNVIDLVAVQVFHSYGGGL